MLHDNERRNVWEAVSRSVPDTPGVYTWLGDGGEALYVGKAVNLRRRMLSTIGSALGAHSLIV